MKQVIHILPVILNLPEGLLHLTADVVATDNPNVFLIKKVSFQKDGNIVPFMNEFELEKRKAADTFQWFSKEKITGIGSAIGKAIELQIMLLK